MSVQQAHGIAVDFCPQGCPVILLVDQNGALFASVHIAPDNIEPFVELLREAAADGAAALRPPV